MIRISEKEFAMIMEVARRISRRTGRSFVVRWDRIILDKSLTPIEPTPGK